VLRLCGPATGENRTVGSQDRTVGKNAQKKHFYSLDFKLGQTATKSAKKIKQIPDNPRIRPADFKYSRSLADSTKQDRNPKNENRPQQKPKRTSKPARKRARRRRGTEPERRRLTDRIGRGWGA